MIELPESLELVAEITDVVSAVAVKVAMALVEKVRVTPSSVYCPAAPGGP
jgi:hypothetical protein